MIILIIIPCWRFDDNDISSFQNFHNYLDGQNQYIQRKKPLQIVFKLDREIRHATFYFA